jgi:hypothetical protein
MIMGLSSYALFRIDEQRGVATLLVKALMSEPVRRSLLSLAGGKHMLSSGRCGCRCRWMRWTCRT